MEINPKQLITYTDDASAELDASSDAAKDFYQRLFQLHEISILLSKTQTLNDLYRVAVECAVTRLDIDRLGILLVDHERQYMVGTWGTDDFGIVRDESDYAAPLIPEILEVIAELSTKGKVCVWHNTGIYEFGEQDGEVVQVGEGWNAAIAFWDNDSLVGWIACDNLLNHKPFDVFQSHILRLFGNLVGELVIRKKAEVAVSELNNQLEQRITERTLELMKAKQALQEMNSQLEDKVIQRTAALNEKNQQLQQTLSALQSTQQQLLQAEKQAALSHLVIGVAHELNTPLGIAITASSDIPNWLNQIHQAIASGALSKQKLQSWLNNADEDCSLVIGNLRRASDLIQQFKQLSVDSDEELKRETINAKVWLEGVIDYTRAHHEPLFLQHPNLEIRQHCEPADLQLSIYSGPMLQIAEALLTNALAHGCNPQQPCISLSLQLHQQQIHFTIEDNGPGVDSMIASSIFDPFITSARGKGHKGLGLNVVYNLVTLLLKGHITTSISELGGACFTIVIPQA